MRSKAESCGIYDEHEILQAIRFLSDLGSLQYFENNGLKDKVVINPQVYYHISFFDDTQY